MPQNENTIISHVVYKWKTGEVGERPMKAIIFPHGNKDKIVLILGVPEKVFLWILGSHTIATGVSA